MDVSLDVPAGSVCALLGERAGKTTTVRILTTLLDADGGHAEVAGFDIATQADKVRGRIGVTGQTATMDELLTGHENLEIIGRFSISAPPSPAGAPMGSSPSSISSPPATSSSRSIRAACGGGSTWRQA